MRCSACLVLASALYKQADGGSLCITKYLATSSTASHLPLLCEGPHRLSKSGLSGCAAKDRAALACATLFEFARPNQPSPQPLATRSARRWSRPTRCAGRCSKSLALSTVNSWRAGLPFRCQANHPELRLQMEAGTGCVQCAQ